MAQMMWRLLVYEVLLMSVQCLSSRISEYPPDGTRFFGETKQGLGVTSTPLNFQDP